jgi:putative transposase
MLRCWQDAVPKACDDSGASPRQFNEEDDHVHPRAGYPPKVTVSGPVNSPKDGPARRSRPEFTGPVNQHIMHGRSWPPHFTAPYGGAPLSTIRQNIKQQGGRLTQLPGLTHPEGQGLHPAIPVSA